MPEAPKRFKKRDDKFGAGRRRRVCSFCSDKQGYIDYKEINRLRRYLSDRAKIEPRRKTGTCAQHQREVTAASSARGRWRSCRTHRSIRARIR